MDELIEIIADDAERRCEQDPDTEEDAYAAGEFVRDFLGNVEIVEGELDRGLYGFLSTMVCFADGIPGGSRADYIADHIIDALAGYEIVGLYPDDPPEVKIEALNLDDEHLAILAANVHDNAVYPSRIIEELGIADRYDELLDAVYADMNAWLRKD